MKRRHVAVLVALPSLVSIAVCSIAYGIDLDMSIGTSYWNDSPAFGDWREEYYHEWSISSKFSIYYPLGSKIRGGLGLMYSRWFVDKPTGVPSAEEPLSGKKALYEFLIATRYYMAGEINEGRAVLFTQLGASVFVEDSEIKIEKFDGDHNSLGERSGYYQDGAFGVSFGIGGGCKLSKRASLIFLSRINHIYGEDCPNAVITFSLGLAIGTD
jgi:hypothetical protein